MLKHQLTSNVLGTWSLQSQARYTVEMNQAMKIWVGLLRFARLKPDDFRKAIRQESVHCLHM